MRPTVFHIPVCPFSQRVEILLALKGRSSDVAFEVVDITKPRDPALLAKADGKSALPLLETEDGGILRESLVILQYFEERFSEVPVRQADPYRRANENMLCTLEGEFVNAGYTFVMSQDRSKRDALEQRLLASYAEIDAFLVKRGGAGPFLFERFGWAETVFTPIFRRFQFVEYYEGFELPREARFDRVRRWVEASLGHPAAQQVTREETVKLYYDYALGAGNGALVEGRMRSSFVFEPHWSKRPYPPRDKYGPHATDAELGLV